MANSMPRRGRILAALVAVAVLAGCGGRSGDGPPDLKTGDRRCAACGMAVANPRFAAAIRTADEKIAAYDAIECLVRDLRSRKGSRAPDEIWLADLPTGELQPAARMTVVLADFPSPMGGGFAAFLSPQTAVDEARRRSGVAGSLAQFVAGTLQRPRSGE